MSRDAASRVSTTRFACYCFSSLASLTFPASAANAPKRSVRPEGPCVTRLEAAMHSDAGTFHRIAAAAMRTNSDANGRCLQVRTSATSVPAASPARAEREDANMATSAATANIR